MLYIIELPGLVNSRRIQITFPLQGSYLKATQKPYNYQRTGRSGDPKRQILHHCGQTLIWGGWSTLNIKQPNYDCLLPVSHNTLLYRFLEAGQLHAQQ